MYKELCNTSDHFTSALLLYSLKNTALFCSMIITFSALNPINQITDNTNKRETSIFTLQIFGPIPVMTDKEIHNCTLP